MSKYKKYILITLFSLLMLFGFGGETKAYDLESLNCGPVIEGKRYAVFVLAQSAKVVEVKGEGGLNYVEPEDGELRCVLVSNNKTTLNFDDFLEANIFTFDLADNEFSAQHQANTEGSGQLNALVSALTERGFTDWWWDKNLRVIEVELKRTTDLNNGYSAPVSKPGLELGFRQRYRIQKDGSLGNVYLYFVTFTNGGGTAPVLAIPKEKCWELDEATCKGVQYAHQCFWHEIPNSHKCQSRLDTAICEKLPINLCGTDAGSQACSYDKVENRCYTILQKSIAESYDTPAGYTGPIPPCGFRGDCKDTNDIVQLVVNFVANILLPFVGGAVFIMFVYGGFTIILSFGNPEKVKKGWGILIASLVGMGIVFGAYLLLDFVFTSLNISAGFRGFGR